jgi:hypothetical protein
LDVDLTCTTTLFPSTRLLPAIAIAAVEQAAIDLKSLIRSLDQLLLDAVSATINLLSLVEMHAVNLQLVEVRVWLMTSCAF